MNMRRQREKRQARSGPKTNRQEFQEEEQTTWKQQTQLEAVNHRHDHKKLPETSLCDLTTLSMRFADTTGKQGKNNFLGSMRSDG